MNQQAWGGDCKSPFTEALPVIFMDRDIKDHFSVSLYYLGDVQSILGNPLLILLLIGRAIKRNIWDFEGLYNVFSFC